MDQIPLSRFEEAGKTFVILGYDYAILADLPEIGRLWQVSKIMINNIKSYHMCHVTYN